MKNRVWAGRLPRYWTESPWIAEAGGEVFLLAPDEDARALWRVTLGGVVIWKKRTVSNVLVSTSAGRILTARIRDGRSDAVYFQFTAYDTATGELVWQLPAEVQVRRHKSSGSPFRTLRGDLTLVDLDTWRDLQTGVTYAMHSELRGTEPLAATCIQPGPQGLKVTWQDRSWDLVGYSKGQVRGTKGSLLVGLGDRTLWVRSLQDGNMRWQVDLADGVVEPSGRIGGLDEEVHPCQANVPAVAVMNGERMAILRQVADETLLFELPGNNRLDAWEAEATVALVGVVDDCYLLVEEHNDGTGCVWFAR